MNLVREAPATLGILVLYAAAFMGFRLYDAEADFYAAGAMSRVLVAEGEVWRLVTHSFLHGGLVHLLFNSYFLFMIGPVMERELRAGRYLALYLVASVTAALAVYFFGSDTATIGGVRDKVVVGGSGGLFGLVGGMVAVHARAGRYVTEFLEWHSGRQLVNLIVLNVIIGFVFPMISQAGHMGGLAGGFLFTFLYLRPGRSADVWSRMYQAGFALLFVFTAWYAAVPFLERR
jgi:rhomboid protease GluP